MEDNNNLKSLMLDHLCNQKNVFFQSQQIDDTELTFNEKVEISRKILESSPTVFLSRFGHYLEPVHLKYFENNNYSSEDQYTINFYLKELRYQLKHRNQNVKNRRYAALLKLIQENDYFSSAKMKEREPLLYDQLISQYQTENEKRLELRPNPKTDTLVDVLFQGIDHDFVSNLEKQQREDEMNMETEDNTDSMCSGNSESTEDNVVIKEHWGNFENPNKNTTEEDPTVPGPSTSHHHHPKLKMVTPAERDLLKDEFLGIMYSNFLCGKDKDFDYTTVDDNTDYDNVKERDQDKEDEYFESFDSDDAEVAMNGISIENGSDRMTEDGNNLDEEEDELDIYMKHIEEHLKKQEQDKNNVEEFDDD